MTARESLFTAIKRQTRAALDHILEQKWLNVGLRTKMGAMVTIGLTGLMTIFALIGISTARQSTEQVLSERVMLARMSAATLDSNLWHVNSVLTMVAKQPVLRNMASSRTEQVEALNQVSLRNQGVYLLDQTGSVVSSNQPRTMGVDWKSSPAVMGALNGNEFNLSVIPYTPPAPDNNPHPLALIAVPIWSNQLRPAGALAALLDLTDETLFPLERPFTLGSTGTLDIVDAKGTVLVSSNAGRELYQNDASQLLSRFFVEGKPGVETCLGCYSRGGSDSSDEIIAFAPLTQVPWGVVVRQKAVEVFAPVRRLTTFTLVLGLVTVAGALVLVWVTTNSVISPVQNLTAAAIRIAKGDLTTPIEVDRPKASRRYFGDKRLEKRSRPRSDEIGDLARSFAIMRRQLKQSVDQFQALNNELDARVHERTQAALAAQQEAQAVRDDLRAVIDALNDELLVVDIDTHRILQANNAAQKRSREAVIGQTCYQVSHCNTPCSPPDCECPLQAVLDTGESVKVTHTHSRNKKDGPAYFDIVASPMRDVSGQISRIVELSRDVTEERRIKESLVRRNQQLAILNAVALTVNQSVDLGEILDRSLEAVLHLTGIDAGAVFLLEEAIGNLNLIAYRGLSEDAARLASQLGMLDNGCGGVIDYGQVIVVPDISNYRGKRAKSLRKERLITLVHIPLTAKGCTYGSMCVGTREKRQFTEEEQELLTAIGSQIAVAIENARLYADLQHKEHVRGELFKKAIAAQEDERKRIARELHDDTSQAVAALLFAAEEGLEMDNLDEIQERLGSMRDLAQRTLNGVHKLIFDLRPSMLDHLGLVPALRWFAESRLAEKGVRVTVSAPDTDRRVPPEVETALFRVVQEAILNIDRHAAARNVGILFNFVDGAVVVNIQDDGVGFDLGELSLDPNSPRGLGLVGMQERVELLGGQMDISTTPGCGTEVDIRVPLAEEEHAYA